MSNKTVLIDAEIQSKILKMNQNRKIRIDHEIKTIGIQASGRQDQYKQFKVSDILKYSLNQGILKVCFKNGREYQIDSQKSQIIFDFIKSIKQGEILGRLIQADLSVPKVIDYTSKNSRKRINSDSISVLEASWLTNNLQQPDIENKEAENRIEQKVFLEDKYFIDPQSWRLDETQFRYILTNDSYKSNMGKVIGFLIKKFVSTGTFMGISLPVIVMKPESILQSYAKSLGCTPKIFKSIPRDPIQRMKLFLAFTLTISLRMIDIRKPFNPVIGQTFQCSIAGGYFSAEQISHHPPISGFHYQGKGYSIYGQLQLTASFGLNKAKGKFIGDMTIDFGNNQWIKGRFPDGEVGGMVFGETSLSIAGGSYAYDNNNIICTFEKETDHKAYGVIGMLNEQSLISFQQKMKDKDRFQNFKAYKKQQYSQIFSELEFRFGKDIHFDGKLLYDYTSAENRPYLPEKAEGFQTLKSDSSFRKDVQFLSAKEEQRAQQQKQIIENEERRLRKLRQSNPDKK